MASGSCGPIEVDFEKLGSIVPYNAAGFVTQLEVVSFVSGDLASADLLAVGHSTHHNGTAGWHLPELAADLDPVKCAWIEPPWEENSLVARTVGTLDLMPVEIPAGISEELYSISPVLPNSRRLEHLLRLQVEWQHLRLQFDKQSDLEFAV